MSEIFEVHIEENDHYAAENARRKFGEFKSFDEAANACKKIVDDFLLANYRTKMSAEELYQAYAMFGEDAFIIGGLNDKSFSARQYAEERCRHICENEFAK